MTGILIGLIFTLCVFIFGAYTVFGRWWSNRAGIAYTALIGSLAALSLFFLIEASQGQLPQWAEDAVLGLVAGALGWNAYAIIWKQLHYWHLDGAPEHEIPLDKEP